MSRETDLWVFLALLTENEGPKEQAIRLVVNELMELYGPCSEEIENVVNLAEARKKRRRPGYGEN